MSTILCGVFWFNVPCDEDAQDDVAWHIVRAAIHRGISVSLGCCIPDGGIFELLGLSTRMLQADRLAFLVSGSPIQDTSHELIWPREVGEDFQQRVGETAQRLQAFLAWSLAEAGVKRLTVVLTESENKPTEDRTIRVSRFAAECLGRLESPYYVRPMRWSIEP